SVFSLHPSTSRLSPLSLHDALPISSLDHSSSAEVSVSHVANSKLLHETPSSTGMYRQATVLRDAPFDEHGAGTSWVDGKPGVSRKVVAPCSVSGLPVRMIYEA